MRPSLLLPTVLYCTAPHVVCSGWNRSTRVSRPASAWPAGRIVCNRVHPMLVIFWRFSRRRKLFHRLLLPGRTFVPILVFLRRPIFVFRVRSVRDRTDKRTDGRDPQCGVLRQLVLVVKSTSQIILTSKANSGVARNLSRGLQSWGPTSRNSRGRPTAGRGSWTVRELHSSPMPASFGSGSAVKTLPAGFRAEPRPQMHFGRVKSPIVVNRRLLNDMRSFQAAAQTWLLIVGGGTPPCLRHW